MQREHLRRVLVTGDRGGLPGPAIDAVVAAVAANRVTAVLVREHSRPVADQVAFAAALASRLRALILVSRHPATAVTARAHGVILGWDSPSLAEARSAMGPDAAIGCSVHGVDEGLAAAAAGASFLLLGPVAATPKAHGPVRPLGWAVVRMLTSATAIPVVLIGGLSAADETAVHASGAAGFAAIRGFVAAPPERA